ncbi:hypothetical protein AZI86_04330 [Bdellovibrio bacteriovorus]|uniref:Uncharacterized protein n=1 Tax=Bdellovibrio bacteriovorus TaxID=959 RepID=A0A150WPD8_BDEBC|nr:hypothetical protein [Bdellovibrio bacteriovorus]KYG66290.1 hypothetical protein AZI86_04330 [Bdellovibrio bacteriovorus]
MGIFSFFLFSMACTDLYQKSGAFEFQRFQGDINCQVLASPADAGTDYFRSAVFTDEGMFMVFNSYEYNKGTDGARVFYFFPRTRMPGFEKQPNGEMLVQTSASGISITYDKSERRFAGMLGGTLTEDPKVHPGNNGGVEIRDVKTLWLDVGFKFKGDPSADASRSSIFTDVTGQRCEVSNKEIFSFTSDGDSFFKFTDSELKAFLKNRCPALHVNF